MPDKFGEKTFQEVFFELNYLNPQAIIKLSPNDSMFRTILSSVPGEQLCLPHNFYYNEKNGITNKHNTESGMYMAIHVEPLQIQKYMQQPQTGIIDKIKQKIFSPAGREM